MLFTLSATAGNYSPEAYCSSLIPWDNFSLLSPLAIAMPSMVLWCHSSVMTCETTRVQFHHDEIVITLLSAPWIAPTVSTAASCAPTCRLMVFGVQMAPAAILMNLWFTSGWQNRGHLRHKVTSSWSLLTGPLATPFTILLPWLLANAGLSNNPGTKTPLSAFYRLTVPLAPCMVSSAGCASIIMYPTDLSC
jgi:hypothetical protein